MKRFKVYLFKEEKQGKKKKKHGRGEGFFEKVQFGSVQLLSPVWLFATPWTAARQASLSFRNSWSLLKHMSIESVMPSNHLILCRPLLLLLSIFPSIRVFSNESALHIRWPKYWSFSFSISPSNEYSGFISFRMDWLDLLAVQGTLKRLLQHHNSKASILGAQEMLVKVYHLRILPSWLKSPTLSFKTGTNPATISTNQLRPRRTGFKIRTPRQRKYFYFFAALRSLWHLNPQPGIKPRTMAATAPCPNYLTTREVPEKILKVGKGWGKKKKKPKGITMSLISDFWALMSA